MQRHTLTTVRERLPVFSPSRRSKFSVSLLFFRFSRCISELSREVRTKEKKEKVAEKLRLLRKMYYLCTQVSANRRKRRKLRLIL
jgi:hypothetical protein